MLTKDRESVNSDRVATAKDAKELGNVLLGPSGGPDAPRQLYDIFVEVMSHQVALLNGVMEGVKTLLDQLSPKSVEEDYEKTSFGEGHLPHGWASAFKGKGHDRLVSRRWLECRRICATSGITSTPVSCPRATY